MTPEELLDRVTDRQTFVEFVEALAEERHAAQRMEAENPVYFQLGGALNWQNGDIASFLEASLRYSEEKPFHQLEVNPSWRMIAEFLYCGKVIE